MKEESDFASTASVWLDDERGSTYSVTWKLHREVHVFCSTSRQGVLRGLHFQPGMTKKVICLAGAFQDVIVDLRVGSPTFLKAEMTIMLPKANSRDVHVPDGWGHGLLALEDGSVAMYELSREHDRDTEGAIHALDAALDIPWDTSVDLIISKRDMTAMSVVDYLKNPVFKFKDSA